MRDVETFLRNLDVWVEDQKRVLEFIRRYRSKLDKCDRLDLILTIRYVCSRMLKTIKGFETWLQSPFIVGPMPLEVVKEVQERLSNIMLKILDLSIEHVNEYRNHLVKLLESREELHPLFEEEEEERGETSRESRYRI
ncbi:MAG: DUF2153 domain-containing protein [Thermoprotei archaeon]|nr:MAG: DUF2153 domain-containing protein [Thermoprotei archaeon]RLE56796.1 MAG: DUF2153 domain-containing protein [Thermoprotei archaeon]